MESTNTRKRSNSPAEDLSVSSLLIAAFDSTESVRFIVSEDGTVLHFNRKAYENSILIHQRELKKGDNLFDFAKDTVNKIENSLKADLKRTFAGETFVIEKEIKYQTQSIWIQIEYVPVVLNQAVVAAVIINTDITERKKKEFESKELLLEVQSSGKNRLQQVAYMLDGISLRQQEIRAGLAGQPKTSLQLIDRLFMEIGSLRNKVHAWMKSA